MVALTSLKRQARALCVEARTNTLGKLRTLLPPTPLPSVRDRFVDRADHFHRRLELADAPCQSGCPGSGREWRCLIGAWMRPPYQGSSSRRRPRSACDGVENAYLGLVYAKTLVSGPRPVAALMATTDEADVVVPQLVARGWVPLGDPLPPHAEGQVVIGADRLRLVIDGQSLLDDLNPYAPDGWWADIDGHEDGARSSPSPAMSTWLRGHRPATRRDCGNRPSRAGIASGCHGPRPAELRSGRAEHRPHHTDQQGRSDTSTALWARRETSEVLIKLCRGRTEELRGLTRVTWTLNATRRAPEEARLHRLDVITQRSGLSTVSQGKHRLALRSRHRRLIPKRMGDGRSRGRRERPRLLPGDIYRVGSRRRATRKARSIGRVRPFRRWPPASAPRTATPRARALLEGLHGRSASLWR